MQYQRYKFWRDLTSEKELSIKVLNTHAEDVMDLSWSRDEKRVILGSLDHSVLVFEEQVVSSSSNMVAGGNGVGGVEHL